MEDRNYQNNADKIFTVLSEKFIPSWCQTPEHWSARLSNYFWPWNDCGCCLFYRGVTIGACLGGAAGVMFGIMASK